MHHGFFTICLAVVILTFTTDSFAGRGDRSGRGRGSATTSSPAGVGSRRGEFAEAMESDSTGFGSGLVPGSKPVYQGPNLVLRYLSQTLHIEDITPLSPTLELALALQKRPLEQGTQERRWPVPLTPEQQNEALQFYGPEVTAALRNIVPDFGRPTYSNVALIAEAGVGKTHLLMGLAAFLSYGILTPEFRQLLNMQEGDQISPQYGTSPGREPKPYELFRNTLIGKTDFVYVNMEILGQDNTQEDEDGKKKAFESQEVRIERIVKALFVAAQAEYNRRDGSGRRVGRRTIFVFEEIATLPLQVQQHLKPLLDKTGLRNPHDTVQDVLDRGYAALAMTTPREWEIWKGGDAATERRFALNTLTEPDDQATFEIARRRADGQFKNLYGVTISDSALAYIISMKRFFTNPQQANPGATLHTLGGIYTWYMKYAADMGSEIGIRQAQLYLKERQNWTDIWFDDANGNPPFHNFEARMKEYVVGQDEIIEQMGQDLRMWALSGYKDQPPIYILAGRTGTGKGTIHEAFNRIAYRNTSLVPLIHNLAGVRQEKMETLLHGPQRGNAGSHLRGQVAEGYLAHPGAILFDEVHSAPSDTLRSLNVPLEQGVLTGSGNDPRPVSINDPVFIALELNIPRLEALTEEERDREYQRISHQELSNILRAGTDNGTKAAFTQSLIDRVTRVGNMFFLRRLTRADYQTILQNITLPKIQRGVKAANNLTLEVAPEINAFILDFLLKLNSGARGLESLAKDLTKKAVTESIGRGLIPRYDGHAGVSMGGTATSPTIIVTNLATGEVVNEIPVRKLIRDRGACESILAGLASS